MKYIIFITTFILVFMVVADLDSGTKFNHLPTNVAKNIKGIASYYDYTIGDWSSVGHCVCATRDFARYSMVKVTNINNGKSVICKVTDYGPDESIFPERVVDLSSTAFGMISDTKFGVADVIVEQQ